MKIIQLISDVNHSKILVAGFLYVFPSQLLHQNLTNGPGNFTGYFAYFEHIDTIHFRSVHFGWGILYRLYMRFV